MSIDAVPIGVRTDPLRVTWTSADSVLYALAVGAGGNDPVGELAFTTDDSEGFTHRVLPTFGVVLGTIDPKAASNPLNVIDDPNKLVHAGEELVCHRELPAAGEVDIVYWVESVWDKGTVAVVECAAEGVLVGDDEPVFTQTASVMVMGAGGFGGDRGPSAAATAIPDRPADREVGYRTRPEQALLYRLTGDRARHNSDPKAAAAAGFERPILQGLCTFGFAGRALLHAVCDSDPTRFKSMSCRFVSPVLPGEDLVTRMWDLDDGCGFDVAAGDGRVVIGHGRFGVRD